MAQIPMMGMSAMKNPSVRCRCGITRGYTSSGSGAGSGSYPSHTSEEEDRPLGRPGGRTGALGARGRRYDEELVVEFVAVPSDDR